jgi:hypothetical protein
MTDSRQDCEKNAPQAVNASHADPPSLGFDTFRERRSQAGSAVFLGHSRVELLELDEQPRQVSCKIGRGRVIRTVSGFRFRPGSCCAMQAITLAVVRRDSFRAKVRVSPVAEISGFRQLGRHSAVTPARQLRC